MYNLRRKLFSQNFLHNQQLVSQLVGQSTIDKNDLVLEIGSGRGIITTELIKHAGHVIAVELDNYWYRFLRQKLAADNFTLYHSDFLAHPLPRLPYKIFANIPFAIEGKIIRKLIEADNPPQDCYLVVMRDLANRLVASHEENMFSVMYKPWFELSIVHHFKPTDFSPVPSVTPVLFRFVKKPNSLLPFNERRKYQKFIKVGFGNGKSVRNNLKLAYSLQKIDEALHGLSISRKSQPTQLKLSQWISLYRRLVGPNDKSD